MEQYKKDFAVSSLECGALDIGEKKTLKSGRKCCHFFDSGKFSDGKYASRLGKFYASAVNGRFDDFDVIFGPAYKGIPLATLTAAYLNDTFGVSKNYAHNRKKPKKHGEATDAKEFKKNWIVGNLSDGDRVLMVDDVFTTGGTKYDTIELLNKCAENLEFAGLVISLDRQEVGKGETSAIEDFERDTGIPVEPIANITEVVLYLAEEGLVSQREKEKVKDYLEIYGTKSARRAIKNW